RARTARADRAGDCPDRVWYLWIVRVVRRADRQGAPAGVPPGDAVRELQAARGTSLTDAQAPPISDPVDSGAKPGRRRIAILLAVALAVLAADLISKTIVVTTLSDRAPVRLLGGFLKLTVSRNPGAAFSIGPSMTVVFSAIAVGVIVFILRTSRR